MKSLFLRILVSLWLAMALLVGALAAIHAWAFPPEAGSQRQRFMARSAETRGENALLCMRQGLDDCERPLRSRESREQRLALYRDGALELGQPIAGALELAQAALAAPERYAYRAGDDDDEEREYAAVVLARDPRYVVVSEGPMRSRWFFFILPDTLPYRLLAIVLVTGLVAVLLARYLSEPIARLRRATQQIAAGDLSVRVAGQIAHADAETRALGRDLDAMAERIAVLLDSERRLRRDISHELRSPLTRLNIALELIRRRSPEDLAPAFDRIERDTARLDAMIGELLTLNRLEAEPLAKRESIDLSSLARSVVEDVAIEAERRGSRVILRAPDACPVGGNGELLRRAIENVLRNAVRFTASGEAVEVELARDCERATIRVRDHGPGVPPDALDKIWKPFYRVEGDRARNTGGTGLGLAITEQAINLHGGKVRAENHEGGGLVVMLELPIAAVAARALSPSPSPAAPSAPAGERAATSST
jgi:two-component system sensor histidine kinase CpxA